MFSVFTSTLPPSTYTVHTVREEYAARLIQVQWRRFALRREKIIQMFTGGRKRVLKVKEVYTNLVSLILKLLAIYLYDEC